jgi:hypothetical protein
MEIYEMIVERLSRDDVKALRLTCKEIEFRITNVLLKTMVVPFNTEIYGMLLDAEGEGKMSEYSHLKGPYRISWGNPVDRNVAKGSGVDLFKGFGHHIKRFGMSFEVDEGT